MRWIRGVAVVSALSAIIGMVGCGASGDGGGRSDGVMEDAALADIEDSRPVADLTPEEARSADLPDDLPADLPADLSADPMEWAIGSSCATDADCGGEGLCLSWLPGGYCTQPACGTDAPCPVDTICAPIHHEGVEGTVCLAACDNLGDCRVEDGYACDRDGTCWPGGDGLGLYPLGGECMLDTECGADFGAVCYPEHYADQLTGFTDGYCIVWECNAGAPCPPDGICMDVNQDSSACFLACETQEDCRSGYYCHASGVCLAGCSSALDCPRKHVCMNQYCLEADRACSVMNPAGWCPQGFCVDGACTSGGLTCQEDHLLGSNDTRDSAASLDDRRVFGLRICPGDEDWYRVKALPGLLTEVKLVFNNHAGNLDMLVLDGDGSFLRSRWIEYPYQGLLVADFDVSGETVTFFPGEHEREYLLKVVAAAPDAGNTYGMITRRYPYTDGTTCLEQYAFDECVGLPGGVMKLYQFPQPDPDDPWAGGLYHFETVSGYLWARREVIMLVRDALRATFERYPGTGSVGIIDACQEDGVTPGYNIGQPRHCRTCHDEGGNIDIAYFALDGINQAKTICGPNGANVTADGQQCTDAAATGHIVDLDRQVYFMGKLFEHPRARVIGIDPVLANVVFAHAQKMLEEGDISMEGYLGMQQQFGLWPTHHHHIHVSLDWWEHQMPGR